MISADPEFEELTRDLDIHGFWERNREYTPPAPAHPHPPLAFSPDDHWLFGLWDIHHTIRYYHDKPWRDQLHRETNRLTLEALGIAFFDENTWQNQPKRIENLFGCQFTYLDDSTPWLTPVSEDPQEFSKILSNAEHTDLVSWAIPDAFRREWEERAASGTALPLLGSGSRGPATVMTSVLRPEVFFTWCSDHPQLIARFSRILAEKMVELNLLLRRFSGNNQAGWSITDDNSALFNPRLYRLYCFPVLQQVLDALAPAGSPRYQHSDSAMGHLLDMQRELGITGCNYGPTVDPALIRAKLPDATIYGQLPPMLLRDGSPAAIRERIFDDVQKSGAERNIVVTTAGSTSAGTSLERMRWMMKCVEDLSAG